MTDAFDDREHAAASQRPADTPEGGVLVADLVDRFHRNAPCRPAGAFPYPEPAATAAPRAVTGRGRPSPRAPK